MIRSLPKSSFKFTQSPTILALSLPPPKAQNPTTTTATGVGARRELAGEERVLVIDCWRRERDADMVVGESYRCGVADVVLPVLRKRKDDGYGWVNDGLPFYRLNEE
ncbi:hypothetical protein OIU77_006891 [Salix suchowensis]|uniref:Uncharacterized protein n=1 Tax=Salix suchowensis TaxID=1278906 RepID=A0ABQ9AM85_9ROSI|nr:hypothetical protein OIU77_006891 [Salix suchowensis]